MCECMATSLESLLCVTDTFAVSNSPFPRPPEEEEHRLRQWLNGGRQGFTVNCEGGLLSVTVDKRILQVLIFSALDAVTNLNES